MKVYPYESYPVKKPYEEDAYFDYYPFGRIKDGKKLYLSCIDLFDEYNEDMK